MIGNTIERLTYLCNTIPALLYTMPEEEFSNIPVSGKWSKKEIVGHLIDSASNNHQRFIRAQFEEAPFIIYDQNKWNESSHYKEMDSHHVISFWKDYNLHLLEIIKRIPADNLSRECKTNEPQNVTLQWLIEDYVVHMEHHLRQILNYP
jgi:hypothetical protein